MHMPAPGRRAMLLGGACAALGLPAAAAAAAVTNAAADAAANALVPWRPARPPNLQAADLASGKARTLSDFAGGPLIVNFWAT